VAAGKEAFSRGRAGETPARTAAVGNPALILLIWLVGASGFLLLLWGSRLTFLLDDWEFLIYRRDFDAHSILDPHGEHIVVIPMLIYKLLLAVFGMGSALPFRFASTGLFLLSAVLLFVFLQRRVGQWPALAATAVVLFLGAAWEDLLWSFQVGYFGCMASGLGALLAFERRDRRGDRVACALLTLGILFSSLGLSFLVGAAVEVLSRRDRWKRLYILIIPAAVYALWYLGWGHTAESAFSIANLAKTPAFVLNGVSGSLASAFGLSLPGASESAGGLDWGRPLLVAALVLAVWRLRRLGRVPPLFWVMVAIGGSFWVLAGVNQIPGRDPVASRYQYIGVIFVLLVAAELLRGVRLGPWTLATVFIVAAAAIAPNISYLHSAYQSYHQISQLEKADLGALDIARDTVPPTFVLSEDLAGTGYVHIEAGPYFAAANEFGTPAYTPGELAEASPPARLAADRVLFGALGMKLAVVPAARFPKTMPTPLATGPEGAAQLPAGGCVTVPGGPESPLLILPPGGVIMRAGKGGIENVELARFATEEFPIELAQGLEAGQVGEIAIPGDGSTVPWRMQLESRAQTTVCGL
jgi:hypothetical protein